MKCHYCESPDVHHVERTLHPDERQPGLGSFYICGLCARFSVQAMSKDGTQTELVEPSQGDWRFVKWPVRQHLRVSLVAKLIANKLKSPCQS